MGDELAVRPFREMLERVASLAGRAQRTGEGEEAEGERDRPHQAAATSNATRW
jgi:hypothetical protein